MKTKDLMMITTAAFGTATLTVAVFWAGPIDAGNDVDAPPPRIAKARLISGGVELVLAPAGGKTFKSGDQPEFELTALNTIQQPASVSIGATMTASGLADMNSRVIRMPAVLWQQEQVVSLKPNETKTYVLCAATNLPANSVISVSLKELGQLQAQPAGGIVALSFSTVVPQPTATVAATR
jgi:hypothetical protein